jgi:hypothetical protein
MTGSAAGLTPAEGPALSRPALRPAWSLVREDLRARRRDAGAHVQTPGDSGAQAALRGADHGESPIIGSTPVAPRSCGPTVRGATAPQ